MSRTCSLPLRSSCSRWWFHGHLHCHHCVVHSSCWYPDSRKLLLHTPRWKSGAAPLASVLSLVMISLLL
uniref:Uncharacterized protein n=1 Tax=Physcomitrium patens TaxID=3218 RepID=A0A2K1IIH0_PHYPA|nr:hypothetical protein PHYPA_027762 [Physcomitrium patens]